MCLKNLRPLLVVIGLAFSFTAFAGADLAAINRMVYGDDPLKPSPESLLGGYLTETHADTFVDSFATGEEGKKGPARLVVYVSEDTFPIFQKYFSAANFLFEYHEPHAHIFYSAFKEKRGPMGRLRDNFRYTFAGLLAIPILLTDDEGARAEKFFELTQKVVRRDDIALFPWRLKNEKDEPYCKAGSETSLADWFARMPIGEEIRDDLKKLPAYDLTKITPQSVVPPYTPEVVRQEIQNVWSFPYGHESLAKTIGLPELENEPEKLTPGRMGALLLGKAPTNRVPVVFRYVRNKTKADAIAFEDESEGKLGPGFDTYFDLDFNPGAQ